MTKLLRPKYTNSQIKELIQEYIHDEDSRKMLFLRLVNGRSFREIGEVVGRDEKTVRKRIRDGETILFEHLPG